MDFDDHRHVPSFSGHPSRSKHTSEQVMEMGLKNNLSEQFQLGLDAFEKWMSTHSHPITLFIIADLFESENFEKWFESFLAKHNSRITVGCHGLTHKSWSAWPDDNIGFSHALKTSTSILKKHAGITFRHWFRAPAGYIAPWMAEVLAQEGYVLDSSVNPSWLVKRKAGRGNSWNDVERALERNNIVSRPWMTSFSLPANGPALTLFPLSILAKRAWRKTPPPFHNDDFESTLMSKTAEVTTVYWHVLDHARKAGTWTPPLR
ncbi:MAG: hypothetical protein CL988_01850 [Euryarchaeota archaeon]|nr:hypothetical protein [Euryarchaeota archaeon]